MGSSLGRKWRGTILIPAMTALLSAIGAWAVAAEPVDFPGTVLSVDAAAGKLAVKKDGGGTRFTFIVTDKTRFQGLAGMKDVKKDDHVLVQYQVEGSRYLALKVVKK
jgi:hypothetical protein